MRRRATLAIGLAASLILPILFCAAGCSDTRPLRAEQDQLRTRVADLERERDDHQTRLTEYKILLDARGKELEQNQEQLQELTEQWADAEQRARSTQAQLSNIREQVSQLTSQLVKTQNALSDATTRATDTDATIEKLKLVQNALTNAEKQNNDAQQKIASLEKELDELHKAMQRMPIAPFASQPPAK